MLQNEYAIGDYVNLQTNGLGVTKETRSHMITLLEALNAEKEYKQDTLFLAASLSDRYLVNLAVRNIKAPCMIKLAICATLMSAKLEQPMQPNFNRMVRLVETKWGVLTSRDELIEMERDVIDALDFELHYTGPLPFLERYLRAYNLDCSRTDRESFIIGGLARSFCRCLLRSHIYLNLKPSQIGAAALTVAVNVCKSEKAAELGIKPIENPKLNSLFIENVVSVEMDGIREAELNESCPLRMWSPTVLNLTKLDLEVDLRPSYLLVLNEVNRTMFEGSLSNDKSLYATPE